ncbi:hypothetical protein BKI52_07050 [marine bacterium AO1-C]|nr:hypothetical protein BKI52_07050 [marine bacterium AO1-C]
MKYVFIIASLFLGLTNCKNRMQTNQEHFLVKEIPDQTPVAFQPSLTPTGKIIHRGIFSPDFKAYYYTISDKKFEKFDVWMIQKENGHWSTPQKAFFNSDFSEHGMSFSPDGNTLYFSSTRPTNVEGVAATWHIWKSKKVDGKWSKSTFVDIPNCRDKLVSHPSVTNAGTLYFHTSNMDYSNMQVGMATLTNGQYGNAKALGLLAKGNGTCTPYISPNEDYLIFANIGNKLDLWVAFKDKEGNWTKLRQLPDKINQQGQGNPSISPDGQFLFFTTGDHQGNNWTVKWVNVVDDLQNK